MSEGNMKQKMTRKNDYNQRLKIFQQRLGEVQGRKGDLYAIMDTVPFQDLEIALMMATTPEMTAAH